MFASHQRITDQVLPRVSLLVAIMWTIPAFNTGASRRKCEELQGSGGVVFCTFRYRYVWAPHILATRDLGNTAARLPLPR